MTRLGDASVLAPVDDLLGSILLASVQPLLHRIRKNNDKKIILTISSVVVVAAGARCAGANAAERRAQTDPRRGAPPRGVTIEIGTKGPPPAHASPQD